MVLENVFCQVWKPDLQKGYFRYMTPVGRVSCSTVWIVLHIFLVLIQFLKL